MSIPKTHLAIFIFSLIIAQYYWSHQPSEPVFKNINFKFHAYCPIYYEKAISEEAKEKYDMLKQAYVITMKDAFV